MFKIRRLLASLSAMFAMPVLVLAPVVSAADTTVTVTPSDNQGWVFNGDPSTATPYEFNRDQASTGLGSLYVMPIGSTAADKFIAAKPLGTDTAELESVAYDFLIAGDGVAADANQFYLNVYTNTVGSTTFYDCRFDYVPSTGSTTDFTTATFSATDTPTNVADRAGGITCPATLAGMPAGSTVSILAVNVGDTSLSDEGLAGYLDNAVVTTSEGSTAYDFETDPITLANKDECKNGGWQTSESPVFKNQGDCVSHFASNGRAGGNPIVNLLRRLF